MRALRFAASLSIVLAMIACAHEERRGVRGQETAKESPPPPPPPSAQFLVADRSNARGNVVPLGARGAEGVLVDRRRVVVGQGEPRVAPDMAPEPFVGASRLSGRFGGGFLFWTARSLYRADAFDAPLVPVTRVPDAIDRVSLGPKSLVVRTRNGERWSIALPGGARAPLGLVGFADIGALDDGRAIAITEQGEALTSTDHGAHWSDVTAQVKGAPSRVVNQGAEVWLVDSNDAASRLEPDGQLSFYEKLPSEDGVARRPKDPRWRGSEPPLRAAFRSGAAVDDTSAIVLDAGDLFRVDVRTGELVSSVSAHVPPESQCEGVAVPGDVLFACVSMRGSGSAFVVSRTLSGSSPTLEQSFAAGGQFYASDDGGLAYSGSCQGVAPGPTSPPVVCVRGPGGSWEERDLSGLATDGGAVADVAVARWVPRADGRVVALVVDPSPGIYDPQSGSFQAITEEAREAVAQGMLGPSRTVKGGRVFLKPKKGGGGFGIVDSSWSFVGSTLRGWQRHGEGVELSEDGRVRRSPWAFDVAFDGPLGLGRSKDGRLYQSLDHGASWSEVAAPPTGEALELVTCTSAGCDLGAFYRVGWAYRPPRHEPEKTPAPPAPEIRRTSPFQLSCRPQGNVATKVLPRTIDSPEDLGLGIHRLAVANEHNEWTYVRNAINRLLVSPLRDVSSNDSDAAALRAVFSGFGTQRDGDVISVAGPNKNALALRRGFSFLPPFDPAARVVRTAIAMSEVVAAGRRAGMSNEEILGEDPTESGAIITLTPPDPFAAADLAVHNVDRGLLSVMRGERVRVTFRSTQNTGNVVSGVTFGGAAEEAAFLEVDPNGVSRVFKMTAGGVVDLFEINPLTGDTYYPANPDALAVGPKGELAILRTPSGSDPASTLDPALLLVQGSPPVALAPWSELQLADAPACKAEPGGYRATLQIIAPWIRVTTPAFRVEDAPMLARVRWTPRRVCLEGFEVRLAPVTLRPPSSTGGSEFTLGTWLVAKGSTFARVGVADGIEWRQALECAPVP